MGNFFWVEIKLPPEYYTPGTSFAEAFSISPDSRYIVGTFGDRLFGDPKIFSGYFDGFLRPPLQNGEQLWRHIQYPENRGQTEGATSARGVNDFGVVVGFYRDENRNRELHGYLWPAGSDYPINFDVPTAHFPDANDLVLHNAVLGINNLGFVVGRFQQATDKKDHGFVWGPQNAPVSPQKVDLSPYVVDLERGVDLTRSTVNGINSHGDIVGSFSSTLPGGLVQTHGYKWKVNQDANSALRMVGDPKIIDVRILPRQASAGAVAARLDTTIWGINDNGWIVGGYVSGPSTNRGFVWKPTGDDQNNYVAGQHMTIDILDDTLVSGIANSGIFVGQYTDRINNTGRHAFWGFSNWDTTTKRVVLVDRADS